MGNGRRGWWVWGTTRKAAERKRWERGRRIKEKGEAFLLGFLEVLERKVIP